MACLLRTWAASFGVLWESLKSSVPGARTSLLAEAGLPDLRIHDLRHNFATTGARNGLTLALGVPCLSIANWRQRVGTWIS